MEVMYILGGFVLGTIMGSFVSVLIHRLHHDEKGIGRGRSKCPKCKQTLSIGELIPLISWIAQRGMCKTCGKRIALWYPGIELVFGLSYGLLALLYGRIEGFWWFAIIQAFVLILFFYDAWHREVDRRISFPAILIAFGWALAQGLDIPSVVLAGGLGWGFYAVQFFCSKGRWVGAGDMELGLFMGLLLGVKKLFLALFCSYIAGLAFVLPLLVIRRTSLQSTVPMGAFLMPATLAFLYWGDPLLAWYTALTGL